MSDDRRDDNVSSSAKPPSHTLVSINILPLFQLIWGT